MPKAVALLSGGMDSTTLAYWLRKQGYALHLLSVSYGQRHGRELTAAAAISRELRAEHQLVDLSVLRDLLSASSLTSDLPVPHGHYAEPSMRQTVVPNRNAILLAVAFGWAVTLDADAVGYAAHAGDHAVYPDCRLSFVQAFAAMQREAVYPPAPTLMAPFVGLTKTQIAKIGDDLGVPYELTWSCYEGGAEHCGRCGTCVERIEAFRDSGVPDPTRYAVAV